MSPLLLLGIAAGYECPDSPAFVHASCRASVNMKANCSAVRAEMLARIDGQSTGKWHDPHNNGTYTVLSEKAPDHLQLLRLTGDGKYSDKLTFTFEKGSEGMCVLHGCSCSQIYSVNDFSTNYCNLFAMYCGSSEGCQYADLDLDSFETEVKPSLGAGKSKKNCLKVLTVEE